MRSSYERGQLKMRIFFGVIVAIALAMTVFGGHCCISGCGPNYSDGERTGVVWKFSRKGLWTKSWEGELNMGGFHSSGGDHPQLVPNIFEFSVFEPAVIEEIQKAQTSEKRVTLHYRQWFQHPIGRQSSDNEITGVKVAP